MKYPTSFLRKRPGPPGPVEIGFAFHNDTGAVSSATAYASEDGLDYQPVGILHALPPYSDVTAPPQFGPVHNPRFVTVEVEWNTEPFGPFIIGPSADPGVYIDEVHVHLHYPEPDPPPPAPIVVVVRAWDTNGLLVDAINGVPPTFPPPPPAS